MEARASLMTVCGLSIWRLNDKLRREWTVVVLTMTLLCYSSILFQLSTSSRGRWAQMDLIECFNRVAASVLTPLSGESRTKELFMALFRDSEMPFTFVVLLFRCSNDS